MEEGVFPDKLARAIDRVTVPFGMLLLDEAHSSRMVSYGRSISPLIARSNDYADLFQPSLNDSVHQDIEYAAFDSVTVDQALERQPALTRPGGSDDGFSDSHILHRARIHREAEQTPCEDWRPATTSNHGAGHSNSTAQAGLKGPPPKSAN
jgi:hypothetical protein